MKINSTKITNDLNQKEVVKWYILYHTFCKYVSL